MLTYRISAQFFVLKNVRVTIICVDKFLWTAPTEAHFLNDSDLAVLAILSLTRRPSFFGKTRAAADPQLWQVYLHTVVRSTTPSVQCVAPASWTSRFTSAILWKSMSVWKQAGSPSLKAMKQLQSHELCSNVNAFVTVIYPLSSLFGKIWAAVDPRWWVYISVLAFGLLLRTLCSMCCSHILI